MEYPYGYRDITAAFVIAKPALTFFSITDVSPYCATDAIAVVPGGMVSAKSDCVQDAVISLLAILTIVHMGVVVKY